MSRSAAAPSPGQDDTVLARLGIKAELARRMGVFGNFAISFSVICILAGGMSLFGYGLDHGGPAVMLGSWVVIGFMTLLVGMSLADVVSAYPTSGGPYFMADKLGGPAGAGPPAGSICWACWARSRASTTVRRPSSAPSPNCSGT